MQAPLQTIKTKCLEEVYPGPCSTLKPKAARESRSTTSLPRPAPSRRHATRHTRHTSSAEGEPSSASTLAAHHVEQHLRTDIHPTPLHREPTTLLCEHLVRIDQILAAVISRPLLWIRECFIGFPNIFEFPLRTRVIWILVRVMDYG